MNKEPTYNPHDLKTLIFHAQNLRSVIEVANRNCYNGVTMVTIVYEEWADIMKMNTIVAECIAEIKKESER